MIKLALNEAEMLSRMTGLETEMRGVSNQVASLNMMVQTVHTLAVEMATSSKHLEFLAERVASQEKRIGDIEKEPGAKWELSVRVIITAFITGMVGAAVARFLMG